MVLLGTDDNFSNVHQLADRSCFIEPHSVQGCTDIEGTMQVVSQAMNVDPPAACFCFKEGNKDLLKEHGSEVEPAGNPLSAI
jgi:hypothetical protein